MDFIIGIEWESPGIIKVDSWSKALALYCFCTFHPSCKYKWQKLGTQCNFPSSPVIYIDEVGLYQCTAKYGSNEVQGKIIDVDVEIGEFNNDLCS